MHPGTTLGKWPTWYTFTYLLHGAEVPLEQLTGLQLVKKFHAFHGTRRFITALTSVRHLSLSWTSPIQSIYPHPTSWRSILILSTHPRLGLPSGLFPFGFPTKTLYTPLSSPIRATCPAHTHLRYINVIWNVYYYNPLHVSSNTLLIIRRSKCINTTSGIVLSVSDRPVCTVCTPDGHLEGVLYQMLY